MPHPSTAPNYISRNDFIQYLDDYVTHFDINLRYCHFLISASFDEVESKWRIDTRNTVSDDVEVYIVKFLVVATGENGKSFILKIDGLDRFKGEVLHSSEYKSGLRYKDRKVLVVGSGNSGMEIAYDLSNFGAHTSIVIRSPFHVLSREIVRIRMKLLKYFRVTFVDALVNFIFTLKYGDLSMYGIQRPVEGPFFLKAPTRRSPVIEVGTITKIKAREIEFHVLSREIVRMGMMLLKYFRVTFVDALVNFISTLKYGDLSMYGIQRPIEGPFFLKTPTEKSPVIEVGTITKIKAREIEVLPPISSIKETKVVFEKDFDVIVFATGYRSLALKWLKDYEYVLNNDVMPKEKFPSHWKAKRY